MAQRSRTRVVLAQDMQMGDITLKQPLPLASVEQIDPFLLLHHIGPLRQEPFEKNMVDIGGHPHRGFEPVTFIFKGSLHHRDSRGNDSVIHAGGVQWMTAGRGIIHSEGLPKSFVETGGDIELIQLWINLPARLKMEQPRYQGFQEADIPAFTDQDGKVKLNVVSGTYQDLKGPVASLTGITAYTIELKAGGKVQLNSPADQNVLFYQLHGLANVNGVDTGNHKMVMFQQDGETIEVEAETESLILYVAGTPIGEKVTQYGPFVMNTQTEIMEAMRDYQMGKMGILI